MKSTRNRPALPFFGVPLAMLLAGGSAQAADLNWQGAGSTTTTTDFNLATNWQGGTLPGSADIGFFNNTSGTLNANVTAGITIGGLAFGNGTHVVSSSGGFAITLTSNADSTNPRPAFYGFAVGQTETVSADLILAPTIGGVSYFYGNSVTSNFILSGDISGTSKISMKNGGTYTFSGNNSFTGGIAIEASTVNLNIGGAAALGAGALQMSSGLGSNNQTVSNTSGGALALNNGLTFARAQTTQNANFTGSDMTFTGAVKLLNAANATTTLTVSNTLTLSGNVNHTGYTNGALTKAGAGTLILSNSNSYTGLTTVSTGTLLVNNTTGSGLGSGNATVNGGTLGGTGGFTGTVTVNTGGTLAPGASIESLASGAVTLNDSSTFGYEVDSDVATSVGGDLQVVSGALSLNGTVTLTLANIDATPIAFAEGTTFTLVNYNGAWNNGLFTYNASTLADDSTFAFNGQTWQIDYNASAGGSNFNGEFLASSQFVNITALPVPEPSMPALLGLGLFALGRRLRSRLARPRC